MNTYQTYLQSTHWKATRTKYIKRTYDGATKCKLCAGYGPIEIHHITYARVGHEARKDLIGLCRECHELLHDVMFVDGQSPDRLPGVIKQAARKWWGHASKHDLWKLRDHEPFQFKQLALDFLRNHIALRLVRLNKETRGRGKAYAIHKP